MPVYLYKCLDASGKVVSGSRDADTDRMLRALLRKEGLFLQEFKKADEKGKGLQREINISIFSAISVADISLITRQLATLLKASVPLTESLGAIAEQLASDKKRQKLGTIVSEIKRSVNEGLSLAESLAKHPKEFNEFYVSMVRSGEAAGNLDEVLRTLAEFLEKQKKLKDKIKSAMTYPMVMGVITAIIIGILMTTVVPNVVAVFQDMDQSLPIYTKILIGTSEFVTNWWWGIIIAFITSVILFKRWKSGKGRESWDRFVLRMPVVGDLARKVSISRFSATLGTMLKSGVPILKALDIVKTVMTNIILQKVIDDVESAIREGKGIGTTLAASGEFPPLVTHMISIGEKSGQLEEMLRNVSLAYEDEVDTAITRLTSVLEPLMIVTMGAVVAFVVFSILMPIMQMNNIGL
ncbi:type II secretion system inner membrane protein GspF [Myxococcota bacterium]|nr:type II secretion system inner membrane protein GspF [Myxococcota bacterium]MBU1381879.1 type II secretion system inner membrane protein GspF [Myxococcota bacterium]MBU1497780.1 type II secretion system inner membrane protein GspF [Myxococcota bacterium]